MRNRIYITSVYTAADLSDGAQMNNEYLETWSSQHRNILTFVPMLKGLFLNGKKYHSAVEVKNDKSVNSVFKLALFHVGNDTIHDANYIQLAQDKLCHDFGVNSLLILVNHTVSYSDSSVIQLSMCVGERVQLFAAFNGKYKWEMTHPNSVAIDRNYIIHALSLPEAGEQPQIILKYKGNIVCRIIISVYNASVNLFMTPFVKAIMQGLYGEPGEKNPNYEEVLNIYSQLLADNAFSGNTGNNIINIIDTYVSGSIGGVENINNNNSQVDPNPWSQQEITG